MAQVRSLLVLLVLISASACNQAKVNEKSVFVTEKQFPQSNSATLKQQNQPLICVSKCMEVQDESTGLVYVVPQAEIRGFVFASGYKYKLRIQERIDYALLASPTVTWTLLETLEKIPVSN